MIPAGEEDGRPEHWIGKYRITGRLGKGGMGMVYRGLDESLEREVAIKTIIIEHGGEQERYEEDLARFGIEARAAARLQHPNIITIYDTGDDRGVAYLAMELLSGTDLESLLRSREQLLLQEKLEIVIQVCRGLAYAHEHGIVHRDIKPANLRLLDDGTVKIMDFGIAKVGGTGVTKSGMMIGTLSYMSPEQVRGKALDGRSDVFSVGVLLYQLLAGERPFKGQGTDVLYKIVHEPLPPLEVDLGSAGPRLTGIVERALAKSAEQRFASAAAMANELQSALDWYTESAVPPVMTGDQAVLDEVRRLLKERDPEELVELFAQIVERNPHSVAGRRALRAANQLAYRKHHPPQTDAGHFPELDATFRESGATARTPATLRQARGGETRPPGSAPGTRHATPETRELPAPPSRFPVPALAGVLAVAAVVGVLIWQMGRPPDPRPGQTVVTPPGPVEGGGALQLQVSSEPPGAMVFRDGKNTGTLTPGTLRLAIPDPPPDHIELVFRKDGYRDTLEKVALPPTGPVQVTLLPRFVTVEVASDPPGARVTVDGREASGSTPLSVRVDPEEDHEIAVSLDGYEPARETLRAGDARERVELTLREQRPPGTVAVRSNYPVDVLLGDRVLASGESAPRVQLPPGRHTLTLRSSRVFMRRTVEVEVASGATQPVTTPGLGKVSIKATPGTCKVYIDGSFVDYPPILNRPIAAGGHTVKYEWPDGITRSESVTVAADKTAYSQASR